METIDGGAAADECLTLELSVMLSLRALIGSRFYFISAVTPNQLCGCRRLFAVDCGWLHDLCFASYPAV